MAAMSDQIKDAFKKYDSNGDGFISFGELGNVMRACADFSDEELEEMFAEVDSSGDGQIGYKEFVDWVMAAEDGEDDQQCEEVQSVLQAIESYSNNDDFEGDECEGVEVDLEIEVSKAEWEVVLAKMDIDPEEADGIFNNLTGEGEGDAEVLPLSDLIGALNVEPENLEALKPIWDNLMAVKEEGVPEKAPAEEGAPPQPPANVLKTALDSIVRHVDNIGGSMDDAPGMLAENTVPLSMAEKAAVGQVPPDELLAKIKEVAISPPVLNSASGQQSCFERCAAEVSAIIAKCREEGTKFVDQQWNAQDEPDSVLWVDKAEPGYDCTVDKPAGFKRMSEIAPGAVLAKEGAKPTDICQGSIGTCFLLGAMGSIIGTDPKALKKLFVKCDFEIGVFGVRFCIAGEWTYVIIDDLMPVNEDGGLLYCSSKDPQECWAPLLEKAYCKLFTCYEMCDGGLSQEAIFSFFGGVNGIFGITDKHKADPSSYFKMLKNARQRGCLLTTGFAGSPVGGTGKCGEAVLPCGLIGGHAYSVLRVVEAEGIQLVCCRNPWGSGEWSGHWSDKNEQGEWTDEMNAATGHTDSEDGTFWMSIADFVQNSAGVEYARTFGPNWKKVTQYGAFQKSSMVGTATWAYEKASDDEVGFAEGDSIKVLELAGGWWKGETPDGSQGLFPSNYIKLNDRPVAKFALTANAETKVVVMLMQPNVMFQRKFYKRKEDGKNYKDSTYPGMMLVVNDADGKTIMKKDGCERCLWANVTLPADGRPWSVFALSSDGLGAKYSVRIYTQSGDIAFQEIPGANIAEIQSSL